MKNGKDQISNPAEKASEPVLVSLFDAIKEKPDIEPEVDDFRPILNSETFRKHSFEEVREAFLFVLDKEKIRQYLSAPESTTEAIKYLKRVRRFGLILRSDYRFLDVAHRPPESLYRFLSLLGDYNDHYWLGEKQDAALLLEALRRIDETELTINPIDSKSFEEYARNILSRIDSLVQKDELPTAEFHELRKLIRSCADLMQIAATEDRGGNMHWLFSSALSLSIRLGKQHDELIQRGLRKEINYDDATASINSNIREEIKRLQPFIKRAIGIS